MSTLNLTPREEELLCAVVEVMKTEIVWTEVAPKAKFTTAKQARDKWASVRAKIIACRNKSKDSNEGGEEAKSAVSSTPNKSTPKKRKAAGESTPAKGKKAKQAAAADVDDDEEAQVKPEGEYDD